MSKFIEDFNSLIWRCYFPNLEYVFIFTNGSNFQTTSHHYFQLLTQISFQNYYFIYIIIIYLQMLTLILYILHSLFLLINKEVVAKNRLEVEETRQRKLELKLFLFLLFVVQSLLCNLYYYPVCI